MGIYKDFHFVPLKSTKPQKTLFRVQETSSEKCGTVDVCITASFPTFLRKKWGVKIFQKGQNSERNWATHWMKKWKNWKIRAVAKFKICRILKEMKKGGLARRKPYSTVQSEQQSCFLTGRFRFRCPKFFNEKCIVSIYVNTSLKRFQFFSAVHFEKLSIETRWLIKKVNLKETKLYWTTTTMVEKSELVWDNSVPDICLLFCPKILSSCWLAPVVFWKLTFQILLMNQQSE